MTPADALSALADAEAKLAELGPTPFPLPLGRLAPVVAGTVTALERSDWWVPGLRERVGAVLREVPVGRLVDGFAGAKPYRIAPPGASAALRALYGTGLALARKGAEDGGRVVVSLGIGSLSDGAAHEALNLATLHELAMIFVVAVPAADDAVPFATQLAVQPTAWAASYGLHTTEVDGSDAGAVHEAVRAARGTEQLCLVQAHLPATKESP
ncbi:MAG: thiamine pyrophosphate-dependent enzyme [Myxococcota bacterium]